MTHKTPFLPRPRRLPVHIQVDNQTQGIFFHSEIMNISKGGVFIRADITLPLGSEIEFVFMLPKTQKKIAAQGIVVWSRPLKNKSRVQSFPDHPCGMGVQFKGLGIKEAQDILKEIDEASKKD